MRALAPLLLKVAWLSVGVGLLMQGLSLAMTVLGGGHLPQKVAVIGAVSRVSWSTLVGLGVATGLSVPRASLPGAALWGLVSAPLAFHAARAAQQAVAFALGMDPAGAPPALLLWGGTALKGAQYAALGGGLWWLNTRAAGPREYASLGLGCGLAFGGGQVALKVHVSPLAEVAELLPLTVNELVFPVLCALVVYTTTRVQHTLGERG